MTRVRPHHPKVTTTRPDAAEARPAPRPEPPRRAEPAPSRAPASKSEVTAGRTRHQHDVRAAMQRDALQAGVPRGVPTRETIEQDPRFARLPRATQKDVLTRMDGFAGRPAEQHNIARLATSRGFVGSDANHQTRMLRLQGANPSDKGLTRELIGLSGSERFNRLDDPVKRNVLQEVARHPTDTTTRRSVERLATSRGFGKLSTDDQNRMMNFVGGDNVVSNTARANLPQLLKDRAFKKLDAEGQARELRSWMRNAEGLPRQAGELAQPGLGGLLGGVDVPGGLLDGIGGQGRAVIHGPEHVASHAFRGAKGPAQRYEVELDGRRIPVWMAEKPGPGQHHSIEEVARSLEALPPGQRRLVKDVTLNPVRSPDDKYWQKEFHNPNHRGYMSAGADGHVTIYPSETKPSQSYMNESMVHETGHILSQRRFGVDPDGKGWDAWKKARSHDGLSASGYARESVQEDFSETLVLYNQVRGTPQEAQVRAMMPDRFKILDEMLWGRANA